MSCPEPDDDALRPTDVLGSLCSLVWLPVTAAIMCVAVASCGSGDGAGGGGTRSSACAAVVVYQGHTYLGRGEMKRDPATTGRVVDGVLPSCDDSGGQDPVESDQSVQVAELVDVPLETAFEWHGSVYVRKGRELPVAAEGWFRVPRCTSVGEFAVTGDWLGVAGSQKPRFDGDLRPPYRLEVHVTEGPREYVGATIRVHAHADTDPGLGPGDVKTSLWKGGQVIAQVSCLDGRFRGHSLRSLPGS